MEKITNAPITPIRLLPGDSSPLVVFNTAATRGGEEIHSRRGGGLVRKDTSPVKKKPEGENRLEHGPKSPPSADHGTKLSFPRKMADFKKMFARDLIR